MRRIAPILLALSLSNLVPSVGQADNCSEAAKNVADKIGAVVHQRGAGNMFVLKKYKAGEITYGCPDPDPGGFLAMFARDGSDMEEFTDFVGVSGEGLFGLDRYDTKSAAHECIMSARLDRSGFFRRPFKNITMDCSGGFGGSNPKVTFEFPR